MTVDLKWDLQNTLVDCEVQCGSWSQHPELEYTAWVDADGYPKGAYKATLVNGEKGHRKVTAPVPGHCNYCVLEASSVQYKCLENFFTKNHVPLGFTSPGSTK